MNRAALAFAATGLCLSFGTALRPAALLFAARAAGCTTMGHATIPRDRFDHAAAISDP